ncbi:MAG TPA: Fe-S cluster assembly protein SufD [Candidatus Omnitrophota bacterium]|nr:Fe-S cluster assembly protein SufD [Candidatus Omnitrophota bacterium]HPD85374.1 Fe-S cluster assembly protein SufD [Candidatus Omnitrophota bacterium]HRZ04125.1 Fe-S cluster assembly protein SufD [Candidatus Omnitrophota bacterium]
MISTGLKPQKFIEQLRIKRPHSKDDLPPWLTNLHEEGVKRFSDIGFPDPKNEEWKFTDIAPITEKSFHFPDEKTIAELRSFNEYVDRNEPTIVFINGFFSARYSSLNGLEQGLTITNLAQAVKDQPKIIQSLLFRHDLKQENSFSALNSAFFKDGAFIQISDNAVCNRLIHIIHIVSQQNDDTVIFPRNLIILGRSAQAEILESYVSFSKIRYFTNAVSDVFVNEGAKLHYYKAQGESLNAFHLAGMRIAQEANSEVNTFTFSAGAQISRNDLSVTLDGEGAKAVLNGLYAVSGNQLVDNHTAIDHKPPRSLSTQLYKGILDGNSRAVFNGKILVRREAQQTNSYQLNKNILLSPSCQIHTKPQLEIFADDVRCTHGATIGQLNDDEIFYLQTRGIRKDFATRMLLCGFIDDVTGKIPNVSARTKIDELLTKIFPALKCKI